MWQNSFLKNAITMGPESDPSASSSLHSPGELTTRTRGCSGAPRARSTSMRIPAVSRRPAPAPLCGTRSASAPARCAGAPARRASTTCSDPNQEPGGTAGTKAAALPAKPRAAQARIFKARHIRVSHKESKPPPGPPIPDTAVSGGSDWWSRAPLAPLASTGIKNSNTELPQRSTNYAKCELAHPNFGAPPLR